MRSFTTKFGFSLIEMLVVVSIIAVIAGGGIAAYINLNDRQVTLNTGLELQNFLRDAQKKARVQDRPASCDHLTGYSVIVAPGNLQTATLKGVCANGSYTVSTYNLPNNVYVQSAFTMTFQVLNGGVMNAGTIGIAQPSIASPKWTFSFTVDAGGSISEGVLVKH